MSQPNSSTPHEARDELPTPDAEPCTSPILPAVPSAAISQMHRFVGCRPSPSSPEPTLLKEDPGPSPLFCSGSWDSDGLEHHGPPPAPQPCSLFFGPPNEEEDEDLSNWRAQGRSAGEHNKRRGIARGGWVSPLSADGTTTMDVASESTSLGHFAYPRMMACRCCTLHEDTDDCRGAESVAHTITDVTLSLSQSPAAFGGCGESSPNRDKRGASSLGSTPHIALGPLPTPEGLPCATSLSNIIDTAVGQEDQHRQQGPRSRAITVAAGADSPYHGTPVGSSAFPPLPNTEGSPTLLSPANDDGPLAARAAPPPERAVRVVCNPRCSPPRSWANERAPPVHADPALPPSTTAASALPRRRLVLEMKCRPALAHPTPEAREEITGVLRCAPGEFWSRSRKSEQDSRGNGVRDRHHRQSPALLFSPPAHAATTSQRNPTQTSSAAAAAVAVVSCESLTVAAMQCHCPPPAPSDRLVEEYLREASATAQGPTPEDPAETKAMKQRRRPPPHHRRVMPDRLPPHSTAVGATAGRTRSACTAVTT
eukprot:gene12182-8383_t